MEIVFSKEAINAIDISKEREFISDPDTLSYYEKGAGEEHYKLLIYLSQSMKPKLAFDIGTCRGASALALANGSERVRSYDISNGVNLNNLHKLNNISFIIGDVTDDPELADSELILLDASHNGFFEEKVVNCLISIGFKGILLLDDINLAGYERLTTWWKNLTLSGKYDISKYGHNKIAGTGMLVFGNKYKPIFV